MNLRFTSLQVSSLCTPCQLTSFAAIRTSLRLFQAYFQPVVTAVDTTLNTLVTHLAPNPTLAVAQALCKAHASSWSPAELRAISELVSPALGAPGPPSYTEEAQRWADQPDQDVPIRLRARIADAAVADIGLKVVAKLHSEKQKEDLRRAHDELPGDTNVAIRTFVGHQLKEMQEEYERASEAVDAAVRHLKDVMDETAKAVVKQMIEDQTTYAESLATLAAAQPGVREELHDRAEKAGNRGPLQVGQKVKVSHEGVMTKAKVMDVLDNEHYRLSLWKEVNLLGGSYESGFDTRNA